MTYSPMQNRRIIVAVSGAGRSLINLIEKSIEFNFEIAGVIASNAECIAVNVAETAKLPLYIGNYSPNHMEKTKKSQWEFIESLNPKLVVLAGFLKQFPLPPPELQTTPQIINIHPSLLPKYGGKGFYGAKVHQAALNANDQISGASIHFVTEEYDEGKIIAFAKVAISREETPETLSAKVFEIEKKLLPSSISMLLEGKLPLGAAWEMTT